MTNASDAVKKLQLLIRRMEQERGQGMKKKRLSEREDKTVLNLLRTKGKDVTFFVEYAKVLIEEIERFRNQAADTEEERDDLKKIVRDGIVRPLPEILVSTLDELAPEGSSQRVRLENRMKCLYYDQFKSVDEVERTIRAEINSVFYKAALDDRAIQQVFVSHSNVELN